MVKLQDGSLVNASLLIGGAGEDDEGKPVKFEQISTTAVPTYRAIVPIAGDSENRSKVYTFSLEDTLVRVGVLVQSQQDLQNTRAAQEERANIEQGERQATTTTATTAAPATETRFTTVTPELTPEEEEPIKNKSTSQAGKSKTSETTKTTKGK